MKKIFQKEAISKGSRKNVAFFLGLFFYSFLKMGTAGIPQSLLFIIKNRQFNVWTLVNDS
jgi:hypothetical protein